MWFFVHNGTYRDQLFSYVLRDFLDIFWARLFLVTKHHALKTQLFFRLNSKNVILKNSKVKVYIHECLYFWYQFGLVMKPINYFFHFFLGNWLTHADVNCAILVIWIRVLVIGWEIVDNGVNRALHVGVDEIDDVRLRVPLSLLAQLFYLVNTRCLYELKRATVGSNQFGSILIQHKNYIVRRQFCFLRFYHVKSGLQKSVFG